MDIWGSEVASVNCRFMPLGFGSHTSCTIFLDKFMESGPSIIAVDEVHCLFLTRMSGEDVVMLVAENLEPEVTGIRDVYETIMAEKSVRVTDKWGFSSLRWAM